MEFSITLIVGFRNTPMTLLRILWMPEFDKYFSNHRDTEGTEGTIFFARSGDGDRAKDLSPAAARWLIVNGWSQAKELSPEAEALFPGRRLPAREKYLPP
jgi:hypothetical protein